MSTCIAASVDGSFYGVYTCAIVMFCAQMLNTKFVIRGVILQRILVIMVHEVETIKNS